ncbi:hypothetical protein DVDV_3365 [Desulfovibrio sp. DV]|nr:hypothetical protein DVDV_3365 [Desulfovibrio sp. DV]
MPSRIHRRSSLLMFGKKRPGHGGAVPYGGVGGPSLRWP